MVLLCDALIQHYLTIAQFLQIPPSAHHIIYLGTFSVTFIHHPVFVFFLEINFDNRQIHPLRKIHTIDPSSFLVPAEYLPIISSAPIFPLPTCPFRSAPRTIISCLDILFINPSISCQKSFFFSMLLPTCGAYALTTLVLTILPPVLWPLVCLTPSLPPRHFQPAPPSPLFLFHFFFHQLQCRIVCSHLQYSSLYSFPL